MMKTWPKSLKGGLFLLLLIFFFCVMGSKLTDKDPHAVFLQQRFEPPSAEHLLGTDHLGRSIFARMVHGGKLSLGVTALVLLASALIGIAIGLLAGFLGGPIDRAILVLMDVLLAFPGLILSLGIAGILGPSLKNTMLAVILLHWVQYARLTRGLVLEIKEKEYVQVAHFSGASPIQIMRKHIFPNIRSSLLIIVAMDAGQVMLRLASLSFLGLGAQDPTAEWGAMIQEGRRYLQTAPWLTLFPGLGIFFTILSMNLIGEGLRDYWDPRGE